MPFKMPERVERGIREIEKDSFENYRQRYPEGRPLITVERILENIVKTIPNKTRFEIPKNVLEGKVLRSPVTGRIDIPKMEEIAIEKLKNK